ncbi:MAG: AsmA family protein [Rickettsiales bacterium]|nr:AsmA family protein [Rickettsiales bacterium]
MKKVGKILAVLLIILLAIAAVIPFLISADTLKQELISRAQTEFHRQLVIDGDVSLAFFPVVTLKMDKVTLLSEKIQSTSSVPLATLQSLHVSVATMPLFFGKIEVADITLIEPKMNIVLYATGESNWSQAEPLQQYAANAAEPATTKTDATAANTVPASLAQVKLGNVSVRNGVINYHNTKNDGNWSIRGLDINASFETIGRPFTFNAGMSWNDKPITLKGKIDSLYSLLKAEKTLFKTSIKAEPYGAELDGFYLAQALESKATINAGATKLAGDITLDIGEKTPFISAKLTSDLLDFNAFLPAPEAKTSGFNLIPPAYAAEPNWSIDRIDVSFLQSFNGYLSLDAAAIKIKQFIFGKTPLMLQLDKGNLGGRIQNGEFYGGKLNAMFGVDSDGDLPSFDKRVSVRGLQLEPFLRDAGAPNRLQGKADIDINLFSQGDNELQIISNLMGDGAIRINNGAILGINLNNIVTNAATQLQLVDNPSVQTQFSEASGKFKIENGLLTNRDLVIQMPSVRLTGEGRVDLVQQTLNYRLTPTISVSVKDQDGNMRKEGLKLPIIVEGDLASPVFRPDAKGIIEDAVKNPEALKQNLKDLKENFKQLNSTKDLKKLLRGQ